jgi:hypothetical protein
MLGYDKRAVLAETVLPIVKASTELARIALDFEERLQAAQLRADAMVE